MRMIIILVMMSISMMMMVMMTLSGIMFVYAKVELLPFNERNEKRYTSDSDD